MCVLGFLLLSLSRCTVYIALVMSVCLKTVAVSLKFCKNGMKILVDLLFIVFLYLFHFTKFMFCFSLGSRLCFHIFLRCLCLLQRDKNCVFCSSWLQYSISHSLSTIQYVLVSQVQHQLQAEPQRASRSGSCRIQGPEPGSSFQLGRGGRTHPTEGSPEN